MKPSAHIIIGIACLFAACHKPVKTYNYSCKVTHEITYTQHTCIGTPVTTWYDTFYAYTENEIKHLSDDSSYTKFNYEFVNATCGNVGDGYDNVKYRKVTECTKFR